MHETAHVVGASSRLGAVAIYLYLRTPSLYSSIALDLLNCVSVEISRQRHVATYLLGLEKNSSCHYLVKSRRSQKRTYYFFLGWWKTWTTRRYVSVVAALLVDDQGNICAV
jgi:hypothetical protein